jgi:hypothetical protein
MLSLFVLGLAAVAIGPMLALLIDAEATGSSGADTGSAGMFVTLNDNALQTARRAA